MKHCIFINWWVGAICGCNSHIHICLTLFDIWRGFVLHSDEVIQKETLSIKKGVALTSTSEFFEDLSRGKGPKNSILALGYAGWGPGQLENEIVANSWMTLSADSSFLFDEEVNNKWLKAYNLLGIDPNKLSNHSGTA